MIFFCSNSFDGGVLCIDALGQQYEQCAATPGNWIAKQTLVESATEATVRCSKTLSNSLNSVASELCIDKPMKSIFSNLLKASGTADNILSEAIKPVRNYSTLNVRTTINTS